MINKLLLAAIAFGLWANAAIWLVRPVQAQSDQLAGSVEQIAVELCQLVEHGEKLSKSCAVSAAEVPASLKPPTDCGEYRQAARRH